MPLDPREADMVRATEEYARRRLRGERTLTPGRHANESLKPSRSLAWPWPKLRRAQ